MHAVAAVFAMGSGGGGGHGADQGTLGRTRSQHLPGVTKQVAACKDLGPSTASGGQCSLEDPPCVLPSPRPDSHNSPLGSLAAEQLLPSRATVLHLRLPTDQRCSTAPQAGRHALLLHCGLPLGSALCGRRAFRGHPDFSGSAQRLLLLSWDCHLSSLGPNLHSPFHSIPYSFREIESHI